MGNLPCWSFCKWKRDTRFWKQIELACKSLENKATSLMRKIILVEKPNHSEVNSGMKHCWGNCPCWSTHTGRSEDSQVVTDWSNSCLPHWEGENPVQAPEPHHNHLVTIMCLQPSQHHFLGWPITLCLMLELCLSFTDRYESKQKLKFNNISSCSTTLD